MNHTNKLSSWMYSYLQWCNTQSVAKLIVPVLTTCYQMVLLVHLVMQETDTFNALPIPKLIVLFYFILSAGALFGRKQRPLTILTIELIIFLGGAPYNLSVYFTFPVIIALYTVVARSRVAYALPAALVSAGCLYGILLYLLSYPVFIPMSNMLSITILLAITSRFFWQKRQQELKLSLQQFEHAQTRRQKEQMETQNKITAELHDSVGHHLTAIIALSEGLLQTNIPPETHEHIALINNQARQGLANTRVAIQAIQSFNPTHYTLHRVSDIHQHLELLNALGVETELTERGASTCHPEISDLIYQLLRESITNSVKYNEQLTQFNAQITYDAVGGAFVKILSNGSPAEPLSHHHEAHKGGLSRLAQAIEDLGGHCHFGELGTGMWQVSADIPGSSMDTHHDECTSDHHLITRSSSS